MQAPIVLTVIGPDRPGLVESIAGVIVSHGGNWLESRMCHLGGQFAGLLRVEIADSEREKLKAELGALSGSQLDIVIHEDDSVPESACSETIVIDIVGQDRPGIVRKISKCLSQRQVNVEELSSQRLSAPMTGELLFEAKARVCVPPGCDIAALREELEAIAVDLMVDIAFA